MTWVTDTYCNKRIIESFEACPRGRCTTISATANIQVSVMDVCVNFISIYQVFTGILLGIYSEGVISWLSEITF